MSIFDIFKKKEKVNEVTPIEEAQEEIQEVFEEKIKVVKVRAKKDFTLAKEYKKVKMNEVFELAEDRAKELEEKGFIKLI